VEIDVTVQATEDIIWYQFSNVNVTVSEGLLQDILALISSVIVR